MCFLYSWLALAGHSLGSLEPCDEALQLLLLLQPQLSLQRSGAQSVAGLLTTRSDAGWEWGDHNSKARLYFPSHRGKETITTIVLINASPQE